MTRRANDFYETAPWQTRALLANQRIDGVVLEPCVGDWSIANLLRSHLMDQPGSALVTNDVDAARVATFYLSAADDRANSRNVQRPTTTANYLLMNLQGFRASTRLRVNIRTARRSTAPD